MNSAYLIILYNVYFAVDKIMTTFVQNGADVDLSSPEFSKSLRNENGENTDLE